MGMATKQIKHVRTCDARLLSGKNVMIFDVDEAYCPVQVGDMIDMDGFEIHIQSVEFVEDRGRFNWYCEIGCSRLDALMKYMVFEVQLCLSDIPKLKL